jgi:hypothetical protein
MLRSRPIRGASLNISSINWMFLRYISRNPSFSEFLRFARCHTLASRAARIFFIATSGVSFVLFALYKQR